MSCGRVVLIGAVHECLPAFEALRESADCDLVGVVTLEAAAAQQVSGFVGLDRFAADHDIPTVLVSDVNESWAVTKIRELKPDLIAVVGWTRLIGDELLELPSRGVVGFHASLLPKNRGRAPVNWAIIRGETETGNTMMLLDSGVDTGRIVDQAATPIYVDDTCATVYDRVAEMGAAMLRRNMRALLDGTAQPRVQDSAQATHLPKRVPAMGVTDWRRSPGAVYDWIRAQTVPYPGAFTTLRGEKLTIWNASLPVRTRWSGGPGEILAVDGEGLWIGCGSGSLHITQVGFRDQGSIPAVDWFRLASAEIGDQFDAPDDATVEWSLGLGPRPEHMTSRA